MEKSLFRFTQLASNFPALFIFAAQGGSQWDLLGIGRRGLTAVGMTRNPQTERSLTILHIKKLGREIDWEGISCRGGGGDRKGRGKYGEA